MRELLSSVVCDDARARRTVLADGQDAERLIVDCQPGTAHGCDCRRSDGRESFAQHARRHAPSMSGPRNEPALPNRRPAPRGRRRTEASAAPPGGAVACGIPPGRSTAGGRKTSSRRGSARERRLNEPLWQVECSVVRASPHWNSRLDANRDAIPDPRPSPYPPAQVPLYGLRGLLERPPLRVALHRPTDARSLGDEDSSASGDASAARRWPTDSRHAAEGRPAPSETGTARPGPGTPLRASSSTSSARKGSRGALSGGRSPPAGLLGFPTPAPQRPVRPRFVWLLRWW